MSRIFLTKIKHPVSFRFTLTGKASNIRKNRPIIYERLDMARVWE